MASLDDGAGLEQALEREKAARAQAEERLAVSEAALAAIGAASQDAIIVQDLDSVVTRWSPGAERLFGYTAHEMMGSPVTRLLPDDRWDEEQHILGRIARGERTVGLETVRRARDGRRIHVTVDASPIKDATGRVVGASKVIRDITALKERERESGRLSKLYEALTRVNLAAAWTPTRDDLFAKICRILTEMGGFRMAWIGWNAPELRQIVPVAQWGDDNGFLDSVIVLTEDRPMGRGPTGTAFRQGRPYICNDLREDPATLPWRVELARQHFRSSAAFPIREGGEVCGVLSVYADEVGFFRDKEIVLLSDAADNLGVALDHLAAEDHRRRAEAALVRAETSDRLKSAFLATMSHELRTPLNTIIGFSGILLKGLAGPINDEQTTQLGMVRNSAWHLLALINDVLDLSKIEAGQLEVEAGVFDARASIEQVVASVSPIAAEKGLAVRAVVSPAVGEITGDRRRVEQILLNLLNNAIKFTEQGGVTLTADIVDPATADGRPVLRLAVADTGAGIRPEDLASLFQPFHQLDSGLTHVQEGTGLGLAICRRLATRLGGEVAVSSEWGKGSEFVVTLPTVGATRP